MYKEIDDLKNGLHNYCLALFCRKRLQPTGCDKGCIVKQVLDFLSLFEGDGEGLVEQLINQEISCLQTKITNFYKPTNFSEGVLQGQIEILGVIKSKLPKGDGKGLLADNEIARLLSRNCQGCKTKSRIFHEVGKPIAKAQKLHTNVQWIKACMKAGGMLCEPKDIITWMDELKEQHQKEVEKLGDDIDTLSKELGELLLQSQKEKAEYEIDLLEIASAANDLLSAIGVTEDMLSADTINRWDYIKEVFGEKKVLGEENSD